MNFIRSVIYPFRYLILLLLLISCYFLWPGVEKAIKVDNSLNIWFLEDDPALLEYNKYTERFGNDESIVLLIKDPAGVITSKYFHSFIDITNSLEAIPEVEGVLGPGNIQIPTNNLLGPGGRNLIRKDSEVKDVLQDLEEHTYIRDEFLTDDRKAARFVIVFKPLPDFDLHRDRLIQEVRNTVAAEFPGGNTFLGGVGVIFSGLNSLSQEDFTFFLGLGYLLMFLLILVLFRSFYVLAYTFLAIAFSTYICIGIYGMLGHQLNLMTTLIPTVLILLGILDIVHIMNEHRSSENNGETPDVIASLKKVFRPCLYTSLTTMAGFLSLLSSPMAILKNFGIYTALGIFLCLAFSFFLGLIFLPLISRKVNPVFPKGWLTSLHDHVLGKKFSYSTLAGIIILASAIGIFKLNNDTYTLGYFPQDHQVLKDHVEIENTWGPYMPFELMITPLNGYTLYSPEVVQAGLNFSDSILKIPGIGSSFGFPQLYYAGLKNRYKENAVQMLQRKSGLSQVDKFLQAGYPQLSGYYIDRSTGTGKITVFGEMSSAVELTAKKDALLKTGQTAFGAVAGITPAGYLPMYSQIVHYAAQSQVYSLLLAFLLVFLLVWLFLKSFKLALLSIFPNLFPVSLILGVMGWFQIDLDIATASISAIVLSFCIDDTLHFMYHYKKHRDRGESPLNSRLLTLSRVGTAIILTSLILLAGFLLMLFASLKTVYLFGLLTSIAIVGALFSHLILLPLLLVRFDFKDHKRRKTLPDM
ncbi:efflux RND transporter permease subunit [Autumnicola psychrophila]|uniref:Efflux RND transporter permease subunit n=1 Tax=Autumnicola psychrophila TaxID=3075592 RepID=A0ABU3DMP6_9FLAO|nr:efflux RND transporter permease subunit [Zunongwangia sp. F225]MDT0684883.1 efflux RND transporter permease subunit [Zunongwangia sp. F225]